MSELQIALLILGAVVAVSLLVLSRRRDSAGERREPYAPAPGGDPLNEILSSNTPVSFDEFGVGKPRRTGLEPAPAPKPVTPSERVEPTITQPNPPPAFVRAKPAVAPKPEAAPVPPPVLKAPEKIIAIYVAEKEGTKIAGAKIHAALTAQGLNYNARNKAYDRLDKGVALYTITSLTAPGHLDPAQAEGFYTPGLGLFLRLPGPSKPMAAFRDLLATADALARALNAVLFDASQQPLTDQTLRRLASDVEDWARQHTT